MSNVSDSMYKKITCSQCSLSRVCLPRRLNAEELDKFSAIVDREYTISKGDSLFEIGQPFTSLYAVRTGSVKVQLQTNDGSEQVVGYHMPGELIGFDAIGHDRHCSSAVALESSSICELPYNHLHTHTRKFLNLSEHVTALMSHEIANKHAMILMLAKKTAEARIAMFLLNVSVRFSKLGFSANQFNLRMSRSDTANYLGLAIETVSRNMTHMQEAGIIQVERSLVTILDMPGLRALSENATEQPFPQNALKRRKNPPNTKSYSL